MHAHDTHTNAAVRACVRAYMCEINFFLMGMGVLMTELDVDIAVVNSSTVKCLRDNNKKL